MAADDEVPKDEGSAETKEKIEIPDIDASDLDIDDFEDEDDSSSAGAAQPAGDKEAVEDFDLGLPEEDQMKRMRACWTHTMTRVQARRDQVSSTVKDMVAQHAMKEEQALNTLVFTWMMSCYMSIDNTGIASAGQPASNELEMELFGQDTKRPQQVHQASQRQWRLLENVVMEQQAKTPNGNPDMEGLDTPGGSFMGLSGQSKFVYVLGVFGVIFGAGALVVKQLVSSQEAGNKGRSAKSQKKAEKAEEKLKRKRIN